MKIIKITFLFIAVSALTSCASGYKIISPETINYVSKNETNNVKFEYKYNLLDKKYAKKEVKKGIKLVAVKITNNSNKDITFGTDTKLTYENGNEIQVIESENLFKALKQNLASYLLYLLLTPLNFTTTSANGSSSSTPVGVVIGPGLALGNIVASANANKKLKTEILQYNINGTVIKKGESKHGLIGIKSNSFDSLKLKME